MWAPHASSVAIRFLDGDPSTVPMQPEEDGYFQATVAGVAAGARYRYLLDGTLERPDPASRFQPDGVHGPSAVVDHGAFQWTDHTWCGLPIEDMIIYELHVGTFTPEGTFDAIIPRLPYLKETVGVTAIELMPVAQFPGRRNWGYDGTYPFAVQASYGGSEGLKRLVDACHAMGMAVMLDVVYNHLGPEGNYLADFGPYFTDRYKTPWGAAINYDGPDSDPVRHYFISNALYWVTEYHIDGLRLDAVHGIYDVSPSHILKDVAAAVHAQAERLDRHVLIVAESDSNDTRLIDPPTVGGFGLDGQWNDDFHHALHVVLTGERTGYYQDFHGLKDLANAVREGFVYQGRYSPYRRRRHGSSSRHCRPSQFIVFAQNHDQIGNRAAGDRLSTVLPIEALFVTRALVLLAPHIPLLFMGEEYGETAPFHYFIEHGDSALIEAVRQGRRREFAHFGWKPEEVADPQAVETFERSKLDWERHTERQKDLLRWTKALIELRRTVPSLGAGDNEDLRHEVHAFETDRVLLLHRRSKDRGETLLICSLNRAPVTLTLTVPAGRWCKRLDAGSGDFGGREKDPLPPELMIDGRGCSLTIPPYVAAVFAEATSFPERLGGLGSS
ncbi:MAG: malto-oligosyltrehalose trehalohydrolase [Nitrospira sp.]|nr:malto-oligosyltrehalose trehalohydrolase [Nitrospira sp.]